jgi:DNA-binding response OmpR family regulator
MTPEYARPMRILLVEDEADLADAMAARLRAEGLLPDVAGTLADGRRRVGAEDYDLLLLDRRLPDGDGLDLSREAPAIPALALTATDDEGDGGPEQLTKPFATEELVTRVHELLRRGREPAVLETGRLRIEPGRRRVRRDGVIVPLTRAEFDALLRLAAGPAVVARCELDGLRRKLGTDVIEPQAGGHRIAR